MTNKEGRKLSLEDAIRKIRSYPLNGVNVGEVVRT